MKGFKMRVREGLKGFKRWFKKPAGCPKCHTPYWNRENKAMLWAIMIMMFLSGMLLAQSQVTIVNPFARTSLPEADTFMAVGVTQTDAVLLGDLVDLGGCDSATAGFQYLNADIADWRLTEYGGVEWGHIVSQHEAYYEGTDFVAYYGYQAPYKDPTFLYVPIWDLTPDSHYYFRIYAGNEVGISYGDWVSFTTLPYSGEEAKDVGQIQAPTILTLDANMNWGMCGKVVNDGGAVNLGWFEFGSSEALGRTSAVMSGLLTDSTVRVNLSGLDANTTYYYRFCGSNSAGTSYGETVSFTTALGE